MSIRHTTVVVATAGLITIGLPSMPFNVGAEPAPTSFSGHGAGAIVSLDVDFRRSHVGRVDVARSAARVDSTSEPRTTATASNLAHQVSLHLHHASEIQQTAPPTNPAPSTGSLPSVDVRGVLDSDGLRGTAHARWARTESYCLPSGVDLATSTTSMASLAVGRADRRIAELGAARTSATTELVANGGAHDSRSLVSTSTGRLSTLSLFGGTVSIAIDGTATATAEASGHRGGASATYAPPAVRVAAPHAPDVTLTPGSTLDVNVRGATAEITMGAATIKESRDGTSATVDVTVLTINAKLARGGGHVRLDLMPLHADAQAPDEGVECALPEPEITSPAGSARTSATPTIAGTGVPRAKLTVFDRTKPLGAVDVGPNGDWSFTPQTDLADGPITIAASQVLGGSSSELSAPVRFIVDATAPMKPVIESPADGSLTGDSTPAVIGTGEPGASVDVIVDRVHMGTGTVGPRGKWMLHLTRSLRDGDHRLTTSQTDDVGNRSTVTVALFTVDTKSPAAPAVGSPADGRSITDRTPRISGRGEPGASVAVMVDSDLLGTARVGSGGNWGVTPERRLADGAHTIDATQTDEAGNRSRSASSTFTVDTVAPAAPVIGSPPDGKLTSDHTPTITGTGEPGTIVSVEIRGAVRGTNEVGRRGNWSVTVADPLADGEHTIIVVQIDAAGNKSPRTSQALTVDATAAAAPAVTSPADGAVTADAAPALRGRGEPGATIEVVVDGVVGGAVTAGRRGNWSVSLSDRLRDGKHRIEVTQIDDAGNRSPATMITITVDTVAPAPPHISSPPTAVNDATPTISGTGEPDATVRIAIDGDVVVTTAVERHGTWSVELTVPVADGGHTVGAVQTDAAGNRSPAASTTFVLDSVAPAPPAISGPGNGSTANVATPTISGIGEPGASVDVGVNGVVVDVALVDANSGWSLRLTDPLVDGTHTVETVQTDPFGNVSPPAAVSFTIDTTAPPPPLISRPTGSSLINDSTPTITGTGEQGATLTARVDGAAAGTTTVGTRGRWTLTLARQLDDGERTIAVAQIDAAGNASALAHSSFTVDTTAPQCPVVWSPERRTITGDHSPTMRGTGEPGATVTTTGGRSGPAATTRKLGTATVGSAGMWSITLPVLPDGHYEAVVVQADAAGNRAPRCRPAVFTIDTKAPPAPLITSPDDGAQITDTTPNVIGTAESRSRVVVHLDGELVRSTRADANGNWGVVTNMPLATGDHTITALQVDAVGNRSPEAKSTFVVAPEEDRPATGAAGVSEASQLAIASLIAAVAAVVIGASLRRRT